MAGDSGLAVMEVTAVRRCYEADDERFSADAYTVRGRKGIAWYVLGWEVAADADTEWSGVRERTGRVVLVMVGDDTHFAYDEQDITPLAREAFCGECGQIGCHGDAYSQVG